MKDTAISSLLAYSPNDTAEAPVIKTGTISFYVIKRGDQLGVRVKDKLNPALVNFLGLDYFPIDMNWRVEAVFEKYNPPKRQAHSIKIITRNFID